MASVDSSSGPAAEPIAVIGSGCRFPAGSSSPSALWNLLSEPRDVLKEVPRSRFDIRGFYHDDDQFPGHTNVKHAYFLDENIANFDASFFNITPAEAMAMDPQQRLLLETVYEAMEAAGLTVEGLRGSQTGVYVGQMYGDYEALQYRDLQSLPTYHGLGTARSITANRLSYFFDWRGPSLTIDTACSSSLVALHQAVQALRARDVQVAVVAGTNLLLGPEPYIYESKLRMLSPDGRSRMWDKDANGYARGDGVAAIMLKTLSAALADGDHIECIIRQTGVNQDGRSRGITMPTAAAQAALIRATYRQAGLDLARPSDRCQYFEAHGTGTPAGDPVEAEAIQTAFFGHGHRPEPPGAKLLVGSVKTIIGHTESTAGLAGILKVSQALQHGQVPPNLLLNSLSPKVQPFYHHVEIPQELTPWPDLPPGACRRASVNSFGFGGTNAHVIVESFEPTTSIDDAASKTPARQRPVTPFVFSAQSKSSLLSILDAYLVYLEQHPEIDLGHLAYSLQVRRSRLPLRTYFSSSSLDELVGHLQRARDDLSLNKPSAGLIDGARKPRILGIFTGQGAQWARMGAELIQTSALASGILTDLDEALTKLPETDRPVWTLRGELLAEAEGGRIGEASISQPVCTAIQIVLVKVLERAGIRFSAVVGHSSGEIAAAFAAGYLSAHDALRIAYYRGFHAGRAVGPDGSAGAMLAVGTSPDDAEQLCSDEHFVGRVNVAACNSPTSVTLSGDEDAVAEMADIFEDEGKFVRRLRVDTAYHSHHMTPCAEPYLRSIGDIQAATQRSPGAPCSWFSSVDPERKPEDMALIEPTYWVDNLLSPVLFTQAVDNAVRSGLFDVAVEVGPHPALEGPFRDTTQALDVQIPYTGTLKRRQDAIHSISDALGYLWSHMEDSPVDFGAYEKSFGGRQTSRFLPDLPLYRWNHSQEYWHESISSRNLRQRSQHVHPLLGDLDPEISAHQLSWKHTLRPKDLPWIHGHRVQGQTVFPAAAYAVTALETVPFLVHGMAQTVQLVELEDLIIHQALAFDNDDHDVGIQTRCTASDIDRSDSARIFTRFFFEARTDGASSFHMVASCLLTVHLGEPSQRILPAAERISLNFVDVTKKTFYSYLKELGYEYSGPFEALSNLRRKLGRVSGSIDTTVRETSGRVLTVHPAVLDAAFHSILLAFSYPHDGQLWSLHLPTRVQRIRVNPCLCGAALANTGQVPFETSMSLRSGQRRSRGFQGDVEIYCHAGDGCAVQVEGLHIVPFTPATAAEDEQRFYTTRWIDSEPDAAASGICAPTEQEKELSEVLERGSFFYLGRLDGQIPADCPQRADKYFSAYINFARHTLRECTEGKHRYAKAAWLDDSEADIVRMADRFSHRPEVKAMFAVGNNMHRSIRGETTMLEHLIMNGILEDYYTRALSMAQMTPILADSVFQVARRYPAAKILEVGAGTGAATAQILERIGDKFATYTFTDVSAGFFDNAQSKLASHRERIAYRVLDLDEDMEPQGFDTAAYDVVVASLVIHATRRLEQTLRRIRYLLKPGGYLIACEITNADVIRVNSLFGCLPGWWQGMEEGRTLGAAVSASQWDSLLRNTGFSGIDSISSVKDEMAFPTSVFVSQAVNEVVEFVREPLLAGPSHFSTASPIKRLLIVGGATLEVSQLIQTVEKLIRPFCDDVVRAQSLQDLNQTAISPDSTVLVLEDLDHHVFENLDVARFEAIKTLFASEKTLVWVTRNRRTGNPYASVPIGFARSALWEVPELRLQFIDFEEAPKLDPRALAEAVLRFCTLASAQSLDKPNMLSSVESEIIITKDGRQKVQRMEPSRDANDRYNSARRLMERHTALDDAPVTLARNGSGYIIEKLPLPLPPTTRDTSDNGPVHLRVTHSVLRAIGTCDGHVFYVLGHCAQTNDQYVTLADSVTSAMVVSRDCLHPCPVPSDAAAGLLRALSATMAVKTILKQERNCTAIIVHNAPPEVANHLRHAVGDIGINIGFTTTSQGEAEQYKSLYIHPYSRASSLKEMFPSDNVVFVDFTLADAPSGLSSLRSSLHASGVKVVDAVSMFPPATQGNFPIARHLALAHQSLQRELDALSSSFVHPGHSPATGPESVSISSITDENVALDALTIVDWTSKSAKITLQPVHAALRSDRTYWLVGLSKSMGLSIADWMIDNGASNLVISSRSPKVDQYWLDQTARRGALVRFMSSDVTNMESLRANYDEIRMTMPPLAGVAQGAMVLKDVSVRNMTLEDLTQVLGPKVDGSLNLDSLLQNEALDFFVFFSSLASVAGNSGQANYTAANLFMSGLAQQRRRGGVAASVINLGPVLGTGVITRELGDDVGAALDERGLLGVSESDVHQIFAEAVNSSHPASSADEWHISTAFRKLPASAQNRPQWYRYPQFADFTLREDSLETQIGSTKRAGVSVKDQLAEARSKDDVERIITDSFVRELRKMLRLSDDAEMSASSRTNELGLDSLVAVRIRSWFLSNFQVNIPALRILMGASLRDLVLQALDTLPTELVPNMSSGQGQSSEAILLEKNQETIGPSSVPTHYDESTSDNADTTSATRSQTTETSVFEDEPIIPPSSQGVPHDDFGIQRLGRASFSQSVFAFVHELLDDKSTLNNTGMVRLEGDIRVSDLSRAVRVMGARHETLRTCMRTVDGQLSQIVLKSSLLTLEQRRVHSDEDISREYAALRSHVFDLGRAYTGRVVLLSRSSHLHFLLVSFHHIIFDRTSTSIFLNDLEKLYRDGGATLPDPVQYLDYSNAQYEEYSSGKWRQRIDFWRAKFATIPQVLPLSRSQLAERRPLGRYASHVVDFHIDRLMSEGIRQLAKSQRSTSFHTFLAAASALLHRFLGTEDVCVGIVDSCRNEDHLLTGFGPFLNMLPLRMRASSDQTFAESIAEARNKTLSVLENALPFEVILNELHVVREATHTPLAQVLLNYAENSTKSDQHLFGCQMQAVGEDQAELPYDIAFTIINNTDGDIRIIVNVQTSLYTKQDANCIADGFKDILTEIVRNPHHSVGHEWRFREDVLREALIAGRGKTVTPTWPKTLIHRFDQIASGFGEHEAVADTDGNIIKYRDLRRRIDDLASQMLHKHVVQGSRVAVFQRPTVDWVVSVIAVMKIGAIYVPLDAGTPAPRLAMMSKNCDPTAVLVNDHTLSQALGYSFFQDMPIINVNTVLEAKDHLDIPILAEPEATAMMLYTSGSSGTPKAVMLQHVGLAHEMEHCVSLYGLAQHDVVLQQSAWSFDLSVTQLFLAVCVGARLQMVCHTMRSDPDMMARTVTQCGVTVTYATPTEYKSWLSHDRQANFGTSSWRLALIAGEPVTRDVLRLFRGVKSADLRLLNVYGPTETTCGSTKAELKYRDPELGRLAPIPVGRASPNESLYILDSARNLLPIGQVGEVCIGGVGVAQGYFNDSERTETVFMSNPFAGQDDVTRGWMTMYRTGDLGYLDDEGTLFLKGRIASDTEIKMNGVRINLVEIEESVLMSAEGALSDAVACFRSSSTSGNSLEFIVVYVVFSPSYVFVQDQTDFIQRLLRNSSLPSTTRPSAIIPVQEIPRLTSGKVDRNMVRMFPVSVPLPRSKGVSQTVLSAHELTIRDIWQQVVPDEFAQFGEIDTETDFFSVGGTSLLLIEVQSRLKSVLGLSIPLLRLFQASTLGAMARLLETTETTDELHNAKPINWDEETTAPNDLLLDKETSSQVREFTVPTRPPRVVVLTGATGFLGRHLVQALLDEDQIQKIICIAVRNMPRRENDILMGHPKVEFHDGDLRLPRLGLQRDDANQIFGAADAVIHNGAEVSHLKGYLSLRQANFNSTHELVKMCMPRNVPLHYISSTGVSMYTSSATVAEVSVRDSPPPKDGQYGYIASKWASEVFLENVHEKSGLPVVIHRPSSIIRPEFDLAGENPAADIIQNMLNYSQRISAVPAAMLQFSGMLDLVYPETVSKTVTQALMRPEQEFRAGRVGYIHEAGDFKLPLKDVRGHLEKETGGPVAEISLEKWISRAQDIGMSDSMAAVFQGLGSGKQLNFPQIIRGGYVT